MWQILERVYDDEIGASPRIEVIGDTQQTGYLAGDDTDSGTCHETCHGRTRDKFDDPTKTEETDAEDNETTDEGDCGSNLWIRPAIGVIMLNVRDDLSDFKRHDCDGTNGYILGGSAMVQRLI